MLLPLHGRQWIRFARVFAGVCAIVCAAVLLARAAVPDQPVGDAVGLIEGEDINVTGPMSVEVVAGQTKTILRSGSDVRVKSGRARISLVEGGQISICGPAHLSLLKAGGSLTVALESGAIHLLMEREPALTVYTAQIQGQSVAIGDDPRELLVGFESSGVMCVRTYRGAMRLENQLSGQSVMVPQGGDVLLTNGQIESLQNATGHCHCDLQMGSAPGPGVPQAGAGTAKPSEETAKTEPESKATDSAASDEKPAANEEPIYQVFLPPLRYDATAKAQPEPDARLMVIVRKVRVRPVLVFQGRVEGEPPAAAAIQPAAAAAPTTPPTAKKAPANTTPTAQGSVVERVRTFFRRLWSKSP
ncbi:MAG: hypothetical protein ABSH39_05150 [Candidatus Acidiferrum sp.]